MKISITVFDDRYKKIFEVNKAGLKAGMYQLSSFVNGKLGVPLRVIATNAQSRTCWVCGKAIKKGAGTTYNGKRIHQVCMVAARQKL